MDNNNKGNIEGRHAVHLATIETPVPPSPGFTTPFKTLQEWLFHLINSNQQPEKVISSYMFVVSDPPGDIDIYLVGYTDTIEQGVPTRRIGFKPANWYFPLPKEEYTHLSKQQLRERLQNELVEFTKSAKFQGSFLSKGYSIESNFAGELWSR